MTTQTSDVIQPPPASQNVLSLIINGFLNPANNLEGDDRQKAASLVALSFIFFILASITVLASPIQNMMSGEGFSNLNVGGVVALIVLGLAYGFSRTRYYQVGAYIFISVPIIAVVIATLTAETQISDSAMFYMVLSIILSSLLLSSRATIISGILVMGISMYLYLASGTSLAEFPVTVITFMLVTTGVLAMASGIREQNLKALIAAQEELQQRIVEAEEARTKAERSDQVKSTFLASMSHELRTPLNAIINFTRFVVKGTLGEVNEQQVETLNNVVISGKHLLNLINDVLDMSKIESDSLNLFVSDDVDIASILADSGTTAKALLNDKPVEVNTDIAADLPLMRGDQQRVHQIFLNLISNACKFTDEGAITLRVREENDELVVTVSDTGAGIAEEDQASVFEAFKQTTTGLRQGGGTGLGMPITKSLIEAHGGTIDLASTVGEGTTFTVHLPVRSDSLTPTLPTKG